MEIPTRIAPIFVLPGNEDLTAIRLIDASPSGCVWPPDPKIRTCHRAARCSHPLSFSRLKHRMFAVKPSSSRPFFAFALAALGVMSPFFAGQPLHAQGTH